MHKKKRNVYGIVLLIILVNYKFKKIKITKIFSTSTEVNLKVNVQNNLEESYSIQF